MTLHFELASREAKINLKTIAAGGGAPKAGTKVLLRTITADTLKRFQLAMVSVGSGVGEGASA